MTFEWLDGHRLLIQRPRYEHPDIPDAFAVFGVIDDQLAVRYYDSRGVHQAFTLSFVDGHCTIRGALLLPTSRTA